MRVWICNPFDNLAEEGARRQRYSLLACEMAARGHDVVWWTASFSHVRHAPRVAPSGSQLPEAWRTPEGVVMRLVAVPPYRSNVSIARVRSHCAYADGLLAQGMREVESGALGKPDVVIVSSPPLLASRAAMRFRMEWGCKVVVDVMDVWPDAFAALLPLPGFLGHLAMHTVLAPLVRASRQSFRSADAITATSLSYLDVAKARGATVPMKAFHHVCEAVRDAPGGIMDGNGDNGAKPLRLVYIGGMGRLYDLDTLVSAMKLLSSQGVAATLDIAGVGAAEARLKRMAAGVPSINFHGFLDASHLDDLLERADVGVIPLLPRSAVAIPYKLPDYASRSLAILECLGGECGRLVADYGAGENYPVRDATSLAARIARLAADRPRLAAMREASGRMARAEFLASGIIPPMCDFVTRMVGEAGVEPARLSP